MNVSQTPRAKGLQGKRVSSSCDGSHREIPKAASLAILAPINRVWLIDLEDIRAFAS